MPDQPNRYTRERIATAAMAGLLAYSYCDPSSGTWHNNASPSDVARKSVEYADALLAALSTEQEPTDART